MNVKTTVDGKTTIVKIEGRVDEKGAQILGENLSKLSAKGVNQMLVDLSGVEFIGSSGIGKLLVVAREAQKSGGQVSLCSIPVRFKSTFESIWVSNGTALMEKLLPIFDNPTKALK